MDVRKIIAFGQSTFCMTLPKQWVLANKLKKGDTVTVQKLSMGRLEITPRSRKERAREKPIAISIDNRPIKEVEREFIAAYIKGYTIIHLTGDHRGKVTELRRRLHELIGVEIMDVTSDRITVHVFSDVSTFSLSKIISRIENMTRNILDDTQHFVKKFSDIEPKYKELTEKKREVNRQSLFAIRIVVNSLQDPVFAAQIESDPVRLSFVWHLVEYMEKISDYLLSIAFFMSTTTVLESIGKKGRDDLYKLFSRVRENYENALRSYDKGSVHLANDVFDQHRKNTVLLDRYRSQNLKIWVPSLIGYLRRISSKSRDIAKITININTHQ